MNNNSEWRYIEYEKYTAAENMAIDEAILQACSRKLSPPTLRFYGWSPAALSIGYFQKAKVADLENVKKHGIDFIRRLTGGRAVLHDQELTYSVIVSDNYWPGPVQISYEKINQALTLGFEQLGLELDNSNQRSKAQDNASAACFNIAADFEMTLHQKKIVGSAQKRIEGALLQHGSILIDLDDDLLFQLLTFPSDNLKEKSRELFSQKVTCINREKQEKTDIQSIITAFYIGFAQGLGITLKSGQLSDYEIEIMQELLDNRYRNLDWNLRK